MDLALARCSGQELRNAYTITGSPDFSPLRRFFTAAVDQLQLRYDAMPTQDCVGSMPPARSLIDSMREDIHHTTASLEDTHTRHSPVEDLMAGDLPSVPVVAPSGLLHRPTGVCGSWRLGILDCRSLTSSHPAQLCRACASLAQTCYLSLTHCLWTDSRCSTITLFVIGQRRIGNRYWQSRIATYTSHSGISSTSHNIWTIRQLSLPCVRLPEMTAFHL